MRKILLIAVPITLAYLLMTWFLAGFLGLTGMKLMLARILLGFVGILAAGVVVWFLHTKKKEEKPAAESAEPAGPGGDEVLAVLREAEKKLSSAELAKGAHIGNLPAILLLGEPSSTKTSTVLHCGLETESLAGQIYQDGNVSPTRSANLWFSRRTLFVEAGGKLMEDNAARSQLVKQLQPRKLGAVVGGGGQAPRAVLVCVEIERLTGGAQALATTARSLRAKLGEISQAFGIQLPVYALFTKTDRLPFFADFVRNLTTEEATQVFGATLPMAELVAGVYNEHQGARLGSAFDRLFHSLCDARPEFLSRENDAARLPGAYEFPREFSKLRVSLVQFLLDLCRPSQLTIGPFLRGFYFSGVRPVIVQETITAPEPRAPEKQSRETARDATGMFRLPSGGLSAAAPQPQRTVVPRKVPQWMFLTRLFNEVLLADRVAMGASVSSTKTSWWRRALLIFAAAVCLIFCLGFTVSFLQNRSLMSNIQEAQVGASAAPAPQALASVESLRDLDRLRRALLTLKHPTLSYKWGLSVGDDEMYDAVYRIYFARFKTLLLGQTQNSLLKSLRGLPPSPGPPPSQVYDALKTYLITTSNPDKSTRDFLSPNLLRIWSANQTVDPESRKLAQAQFDFYSDELPTWKPGPNEATTVENARQYLNKFGGLESTYQAMLAAANKQTNSVKFNPDIKDCVTDNYEVPGAFSKPGWAFMQNAIKDAGRYLNGDKWVIGDKYAANLDTAQVAAQLPARYQADVLKQWRAYLNAASIVKYQNLKDASDKLKALSSNSSPLLALLALASQNTAVDDPNIKNAFQPPQAMVPPNNAGALSAPENKPYVLALIDLQGEVDKVANLPEVTDDAAKPTLESAQKAMTAADSLASQFRPDPEGHVDRIVQKLMEDPITYTQGLLRKLGPAELNAGGKGLCGQFSPVLAKYPFNPNGKDATVDDVNALLGKQNGALWVFYESKLKKYLIPQNNQYVPAPGGAVTLNPAFVAFFNRAASFSNTLYAAGPDPQFPYQLKAVPVEGIQGATLTLDGQTVTYSSGAAAPQKLVWKGTGSHGANAKVNIEGAALGWEDTEGLWAIFRFFGDADSTSPVPGGELLTWVYRTGKSGQPLKLSNGRSVTMRFELDIPGTPSVKGNIFSHFACVSEVAKQ